MKGPAADIPGKPASNRGVAKYLSYRRFKGGGKLIPKP